MMMTKTCRKCGESKELSEFYLHRTASSWPPGKRVPCKPAPISQCKACSKARTMARNQRRRADVLLDRAYKDKQNAYNAAKNKRIKDAVFAAYGGYRCACCGETEPLFLTIDHVNNDGAAWRRRNLWSSTSAGSQTYRWLMNHGFPTGHQVLCMNCNWGKRMNHGVCPHQRRCNDYPQVGVGASAPKRIASGHMRLVSDDEIVSSAMKVAAAR